MRVLMYSSPYQYYADNLIPLARYFKSQKVHVIGSYRLSMDGEEKSVLDQLKVNYSDLFLKGMRVDAVILTQTWWYQDRLIAETAAKRKIPLYVIDHAPPMMRFTQPDDKLSHLYRKESYFNQHYISWGKTTKDVMNEVGYTGINKILGSPRVEDIMRNVKSNKVGCVLFDTSNRMEDKNLVSGFVKYVKQHPNKEFIIQEHSRSPKYFREALKYDNVKLNQGLKEHQLFEYSDFIFTFPSSAMIVPALQGKNVYALYDQHFCLEARNYFKKYRSCIFKLKDENPKPEFKEFINSNILYKEEELANQRIYRYITEG